MAIDTKQKRGSAALLRSPYRPWLSEPSGSDTTAHRLSLLKMFAGAASAAASSGDSLGSISSTAINELYQ